jgi:predicted nucleic acid-binding protein
LDPIARVDAALEQPGAAANPPPIAVRDPDDAVILGEALGAGAEVLVTGDKDLLEVRGANAIRIVDPRGFWNLVRG